MSVAIMEGNQVNEARIKIMEGTFGTWKKEILQKLSERA
mgnify:CR=1 FL=1